VAKPASGTALDTGGTYYSALAGVWALLEGTGTTTADSKGSRTGTFNNTAAWGTNGGGDAVLSIPSGAGYVALSSALALTSSWWVAFRAGLATTNDNGMFLGDADTGSNYLWGQNGGGATKLITFKGTGGTGGWNTTDMTVVSDYFLSANGTTLTLYRDGTGLGTITPATNTDWSLKHLGTAFDLSSLNLHGTLEYAYAASGSSSGTDATYFHATPYGIFSAGGGGGVAAPVSLVRRFARTRASTY
jgi:hypothetical protein